MLYMQTHIGEWAVETAQLSLVEKAVYFELLLAYHSNEAPLIRSYIDRITRRYTDVEKTACEYVLATFFEERDGVFHHKRADENIHKFQLKSEKARKSVQARWLKNKENTNAIRSYDVRTTDALLTENREQRPEKERTANAVPKKPRAISVPRPEDVPEDVWRDFLAARKGKAFTPTALKGFEREAAKAGITVAEAIRIAAERGWQGFKADWNWQDSASKPKAEENRLDPNFDWGWGA